MSLTAFAARSLLFFTLVGGVATPALAQHVVTDDEAGKLTLDALTATPAIVHHVSYRTVSRRAVYSPVMARMRTISAVHEASYRRSARSARTSLHEAHHGKARRG